MARMNWNKVGKSKRVYQVNEWAGKKQPTLGANERGRMRKARLRKAIASIYYVFETGNLEKKVHIRTPRGTLCKMENADGYAVDRLDGISQEMPEGLQPCKVCELQIKELLA